MSAASSDFDPQQVWQARPSVHPPVTLGEIQRRARRFNKHALRRRIEGWAGIVVCLLCLAFAIPYGLSVGRNWMILVGSALSLSGGILGCWRWRTMNSAEPVADEGKALVDAYRRSLIRLHDLRRNVFMRIYLPTLPGMALAYTGVFVQHNKATDATFRLIIILFLMVMGLAMAVGWLVNQRIADKLQRKIDEL